MDNPGRLTHKLIRAESKLLDEDEGLVSATVSTEGKDRDGDIIRVAGWDLTNFLKHPVLLADHNYRSLTSQIGEWSDMKTVRGNPKRLDATAKFYIDDGNAQADWGFSLARRGMAAFSVGFIPDMDLAKLLDGGNEWFGPFEFNGQEMLETSQVTIPAHPDALQRMKGLDNHPVIQELVEEMLDEEPDGPTDIEKLLAAMERRINAKFDEMQKYLNDMTGWDAPPEPEPAPIKQLTPDVLRDTLHASTARAINGRS